MTEAKRDGNYVPVTLFLSNADGTTPLSPYVDSSTNRLLVAATFSGVDILDLTSNDALAVAIVDGSGDQITSFGGGTQYEVDDALGGTPTGTLSLAMRDDALSSLTPAEGDAVQLRVNTNGALWNIDVNSDDALTALQAIQAAAEGTLTVDGSGVTQPISAASLPLPTGASTAANQSTIIGHVDGIETLLGTINSDTGNIATNTSAIAGAVNGSEMQVDVVAPLPSGANLIGDINLQAIAGGGSVGIFRSIDLDESEEEVKGSAGSLYGYYFANTSDSARYLKFYNATAANVTVGTTTPVLTLYLPPTAAGHISFAYGVTFSTAITAAATTGVADSDTGAPGANEVILNAFYK